jgi:hypothetical protein
MSKPRGFGGGSGVGEFLDEMDYDRTNFTWD